MGRGIATTAVMVVLAPFSIAVMGALPGLGLTAGAVTPWGLPAMVILAALFARYGGTPTPDRPLRRAGHPL